MVLKHNQLQELQSSGLVCSE